MIKQKTGRSLISILSEEREYWLDVVQTTNNRLLKRVANSNINKRVMQIRNLRLGTPISSN